MEKFWARLQKQRKILSIIFTVEENHLQLFLSYYDKTEHKKIIYFLNKDFFNRKSQNIFHFLHYKWKILMTQFERELNC